MIQEQKQTPTNSIFLKKKKKKKNWYDFLLQHLTFRLFWFLGFLDLKRFVVCPKSFVVGPNYFDLGPKYFDVGQKIFMWVQKILGVIFSPKFSIYFLLEHLSYFSIKRKINVSIDFWQSKSTMLNLTQVFIFLISILSIKTFGVFLWYIKLLCRHWLLTN